MANPAASAESDPAKVIADPQNPLPESNWLYRRILVFVGFAIIALAVWRIIELIGGVAQANPLSAINALTGICYGLLVLAGIDRALYLIAPSAEQFGNWAQTLSAWKSGISFRSTATAETSQGKVTSTQASGLSAASAAPLAPEKPLAPSDLAGGGRPDDPAPSGGVELRPRERGTE